LIPIGMFISEFHVAKINKNKHMKIKLSLVAVLQLSAICSFSQNVGIGTTTPSEKLQVVGNIKSDTLKPNAIKLPSNAGNGKILTSDADGNASWQKISNVLPTESASSYTGSGNIGYGVWGDCAANGNISEYQPVADTVSFPSLSNFGYSVYTSGNYAIAGIPYDNVGTNTSQGSANIYQYDGTKWILMQKITDPGGAAGDRFGFSVSLSGNYAIVSSIWDDVGANTDQGSVSIYQYNGTSWVWMQKITDATGAVSDYFGASVSISGNMIVVGSSWDDISLSTDQGSSLFYKYNGTNWVLVQKVFDAVGLATDFFGHSVSISGNYAVVGVYFYDVGATSNQGAAVMYQYNGTNWVFMQRLTDAQGAAYDVFGGSVSISGNYVIVGSSGDDVNTNSDQGSASIYQLKNGTWVLMEKLTDDAGAAADYFGSNVFISGNYAIVGATSDDVGVLSDKGSACIYQRVGQGWQLLQYVTDPGGKKNNGFSSGGASIDQLTKRFIVGVPNYANQRGKVV
jgi:hypothetical protein